MMLDDDVIVQGDVTTLKPQHKAVAAGCQQWYVNGDGFESSTDLSYADVPYFGYGVLSGRGAAALPVRTSTRRSAFRATRAGGSAEVARTDQAVAGARPCRGSSGASPRSRTIASSPPPPARRRPPFVEELRNAWAWNFGLVVIDLSTETARAHGQISKAGSRPTYRQRVLAYDSLARAGPQHF